MKKDLLQEPMRAAMLAGVVTLFLVGCGAALQVVPPERARALLPFLTEETTKTAVVERLGREWIYTDHAERVVIYGVSIDESGSITVRARGDEKVTHELVLVYDEHDRLRQYSLVRIR